MSLGVLHTKSLGNGTCRVQGCSNGSMAKSTCSVSMGTSSTFVSVAIRNETPRQRTVREERFDLAY